MDPSQLNLMSYPNWFGNIDFDQMVNTYLGENSPPEFEAQIENEDSVYQDGGNWLEGYEDSPQITPDFYPIPHSTSSEESEAGLQILPGVNTEDSNLRFESELPHQLEGDYDAPWNTHGATSIHSDGLLGATGFYVAGDEDNPLETHFSSRGSGSRTPDVPRGGSALGGQESFRDLALEDVIHYLDDCEASGNLGLPEESSQLIDHTQLGATGLTQAVDSQQIPANEILFKLQATRKHRVRGPKNWEFLMRLLVDPRTNPDLIEWEDEERGVFRLRQPQVIAKIWASRNENTTDLSYNNFARGLRHHYKKGILIPIPERQLVYQCGQQALEFLDQLRRFQQFPQ
ncbi:uncharacterized protein [Palaemon carinicauda]|uniref:uncharacterized protein n=1 Tax=Palaemon carinicauda TaxID=392227 RepID=UPI0035B5B374